MTAFISPPPRLQFFTNAGVPMASGLLYTYAAGTTTPLVTYTDSSGLVANTNPVILDSRGEASIWLGGVGYKFKLATPANVDIWTQDNIAPGSSAYMTYTPAGTGAVTTTVQAKLRESVSPKDFGAVGDGVTNDAAAFLLALQSGAVVDGVGLTYAINGQMKPTSFVGLKNANFIQLSPTTASVATLWIYALSNWFIDNCSFNVGTTTNTGASDDSSKSGLRVTNVQYSGVYNENFRITRVTVSGDGNGSRIQVRQSKRFVVENCLVRDGTAGYTPDPTDDIINGFDISDCANFTIANCQVNNLKSILVGVPTIRYTRGFLLTEIRDCSIVGCNSTNVDQCFDFSGAVIPLTTPAYYEGNRRFTLSGCTANNGGTFGFKFANVTHDGLVTGCIANNAKSMGFVISAPNDAATDVTYATGNMDFVGCKVINVLDNGGSGPGIATGFRVMAGNVAYGVAPNTFNTFPRGVRFRSCEVRDVQTVPTTLNGFNNDVAKILPTTAGYNTNIASTAVSCSVGAGVTTPFNNIGPTLCYATGSAAQAIPNTAYTSLLWNISQIDHTGLHSTATDTDRIYIKEAGTYQISAQFYFAANAVGYRIGRILKNGATLNRTTVSAPVNSAGVASTFSSQIVNAAVPGDYYSVEVYQNSGGALDHGNNEANFIAQKVD
jgi:hypothetical protein